MNWSDISFTPRTLRQFSALWIVFFAGLAAWHGLIRGHITLGIALLMVAVTLGPLGLAWPQAMRPIYTLWMLAVFPIGWLFSRVALAIVYYGVVTPIAIVFRLMGRDVLDRSRPESDTYWKPKPAPRDTQRYLRQY